MQQRVPCVQRVGQPFGYHRPLYRGILLGLQSQRCLASREVLFAECRHFKEEILVKPLRIKEALANLPTLTSHDKSLSHHDAQRTLHARFEEPPADLRIATLRL